MSGDIEEAEKKIGEEGDFDKHTLHSKLYI